MTISQPTNQPTNLSTTNYYYDCVQVSAADKASGKSQKITITSDKGRLSEEEIDRMVREAEENAEADKLLRQRVDAKNQLESYLYGLRSSVTDTLKDKIDEADKETLTKMVTEALAWLEEHPDESKEAYDEKRKSVEDVANPIISKAYNYPEGGGAAPAEEASSSSADAANDSPQT